MGSSHARPIFNNNIKKSLKMSNGYSEAVNSRTNNGGHRKLKIEQHKPQ
jgi:hypothetical protein